MSGKTEQEKLKQISRLQGLYKGRFSKEEAGCLLEYHDWDEGKTSSFIQESEPKDVRELVEEMSGVKIADEDIDPALKNNHAGEETRQFSCVDCDEFWWKKVPTRKPVSRCRKCEKKYDPVPRNREWGWAIFKCECGREFSGFGQMDVTQSECYECHSLSFPSVIRPPSRRRRPASKQKHSCNAADCQGCSHGNAQAAGGIPRECVHPDTRQKNAKPKVVYPCTQHISSGSTMSSISEDGGRGVMSTSSVRSVGVVQKK